MPSLNLPLRRLFHRETKSDDVITANLPSTINTGGAKLCFSCRSIELPPRSLQQNATSHSIGTVDEVFRNKNRCSLCSMISLCFARLGIATGNDHVVVKVASTIQALTLHLGTRTNALVDIRYHTLEDDSHDAPLLSDHIRYFVRGTLFEPKAVRQWLQECESKHSNNCKDISQRLQERDLSILLLDMLEMKIFDANTGYRYLALSYVWGETPALRLSKQNRATLSQPKSITRVLLQASRVVQDAIRIAQQLGERYLWVDTLCIPHDDEDFSKAQISRMSSIYSRATLTLVAMAAECAYEPLLLPDDTTRVVSEFTTTFKKIEQVFGIKVASFLRSISPDALRTQLSRTVYVTRAWTYQERLLSRRCLYIGKGGIFLDCPSYLQSSFGMKMAQNITMSVNTFWRLPPPRPKYAEHATEDFGADAVLFHRDFGAYQRMVEIFTSRHLTYASDIYSAFSGILASLHYLRSNTSKPVFICGLPRKSLELALYWQPQRALTPRRPLLPAMDARTLAMPSWSWGSWVGAISYDLLAGPYFSQSTICWIALTGQRKRWSSKTTPDDRANSSASNLDIHWPFEVASTELNWTQACTIHFWADTVRIENFQLQAFSTLPNGKSLCKPITSITDARGRHCGFVYANASILRSPHAPSLHAFSLFRARWPGYESVELADSESHRFRLNDFPYEAHTSVDEGRYKAVHIMLVAEISGVSERIGVGKIHLDSWQEAGPERRIISLA